MEKKEKTIFQKLLTMQEQVGVVSKDSQNPFFKSKYADINKYLEVVKPILSKNGLLLLQPIEYKNGKNILVTRIISAEDGTRIKSEIELPVNPDPQKQGAIITYYRRYAIQSLLALQAEDSDCEELREKVGDRNVVGNKEVPNCSICNNPMKPTKPGSKNPFFCKHENNTWGKPVFAKKPLSNSELEFLDGMDK